MIDTVGPRRRPRGSAPLSIRAAARALGVDEKTLRKSIANGRVERSLGRDAKGRTVVTDLALLRREWADNRDPSKLRTAPDRATATERRRLLRAQARKADLAAERLAGQLVEAAVVKRETFEAFRTVRDNVLNVPDRVAHALAAETDADRIHARLTDELRQALGAAAEALGG
jgi:phage terminase Nu1 subunit (DNA packaging protein)